jgi:hypothetical protein
MITRVRTTFKRDGSLATQETETWDGDVSLTLEQVTFDDGPSDMPEKYVRMIATRRANKEAKRVAELEAYAKNLSQDSDGN